MAKSTRLPAGTPAMIKQLRPEAQNYYKLVVEEVQKVNKLSLDLNTITLLCVEYHKYLSAAEDVLQEGMYTTNSYSGVKSAHPAIAIQKAASTSILSFWKTLGLTPEARLDFMKKAGANKKKDGPRKKNANIPGQSVVKN